MSWHVSIFWIQLFLLQSISVLALASSSRNPPSLSLQSPHHVSSSALPSDTLRALADECDRRHITTLDVYGDFTESPETSFLRNLEATMAQEFGKEDAVFMPSGVMAQNIALLIHRRNASDQQQLDDERPNRQKEHRNRFMCHSTSHLLLHENEAYRELLHMEPVVVTTPPDGCSYAPMGVDDVRQAIKEHEDEHTLSSLILEVPHRELGGKCTSYQDILDMREFCNQHDLYFHCDGARIFEATAAYPPSSSLAELCLPFDSIYISFYKGLAGLSGAMLLGNTEFCEQARVWLRRFGGNLYTLLPYAVSGWSGYDKFWANVTAERTFVDKRDKLQRIVHRLLQDPTIGRSVTFDPTTPEVNMVHGYLRVPVDTCMKALDQVEATTGIRVLVRVREVADTDLAYSQGYRSKFEWTMGEANGAIADEPFFKGWKDFIALL